MSKLLTNSPGFVSKLLHHSKMPAFTLYGARGSTNTDRVRLTLAEGGFTDYELVVLNLQKGEQKVRVQNHFISSLGRTRDDAGVSSSFSPEPKLYCYIADTPLAAHSPKKT
jgi:hypothetical protein